MTARRWVLPSAVESYPVELTVDGLASDLCMTLLNVETREVFSELTLDSSTAISMALDLLGRVGMTDQFVESLTLAAARLIRENTQPVAETAS